MEKLFFINKRRYDEATFYSLFDLLRASTIKYEVRRFDDRIEIFTKTPF